MQGILLEFLKPLSRLQGVWKGKGVGGYPTMDRFEFSDQMHFRIQEDAFDNEPLIHFEQIARVKNGKEFVFKHWEAGFLRPVSNGHVEMQITHNTGRMEILTGNYERLDSEQGQFELRFSSTFIHNANDLVQATASHRVWILNKGVLSCQQLMSTEGVRDMTLHLDSTLEREK